MAIRYKPDIRATGRYLRRDVELGLTLGRVGEAIADVARSIAPVDTGAYLASISVVEGEVIDKRQAKAIASSDPAAAPLEFGNVNTQGIGRAIFTRAAEIAGFRVAG